MGSLHPFSQWTVEHRARSCRSIWQALLSGLATLAVVGCGGGGGGGDSPVVSPPNAPAQDGPYAITWTVTGLSSGSVTLNVNLGFQVAISANGSVTSTVPLFTGESYESSVVLHSTLQVCSMGAERRGVVAHANINLQVSCSPTPETVLHTMSRPDGFQSNAALIQASDGNFYGTTPEGGLYGFGTVFKVTPSGIFTVIHQFGAVAQQDGLAPYGALVQGANGHLYGTTSAGGVSSNNGTVYELSLDGTYTVLHTFGSLPGEPAVPQAGLTLANDGNFYGTTVTGGAHGGGSVFRITPQGVVTLVYSFLGLGSGDAFNPASPLIQGSDGMLYGTTEHGGAGGPTQDYGTVYQVSLQGTEQLLHSFTAGADGRGPLGALLHASDGNYYGTAPSGGGTSGTVFRITPAGAFSALYSFPSANQDGGSGPSSALVQGADSNLYGTTPAGGSGGGTTPGGTLFRLTLTGVATVLYSFGSTNDGIVNDGTAPRSSPVFGTDGKLYGMTSDGGDFFGGAIYRLTP